MEGELRAGWGRRGNRSTGGTGTLASRQRGSFERSGAVGGVGVHGAPEHSLLVGGGALSGVGPKGKWECRGRRQPGADSGP